jgi:hypothetical protein
VREVLKLSRSSMPEERLRALWLALDTDSSGHLSAGEFGAFMKLGECGLDMLIASLIRWTTSLIASLIR